MAEVALLVEAGLVQPERVNDIDDGLRLVVGAVLGIFGGGVGARIEALAADVDLLAVRFVYGAVDFFDVVGVRDQLVAGDEILGGMLLTFRCMGISVV